MKLAAYLMGLPQTSTKEIQFLKSNLDYIICDGSIYEIVCQMFEPEVSVLRLSVEYPDCYIQNWEDLNIAAEEYPGATIAAPLTFAVDDLATFKMQHKDFLIFAEVSPTNINSPQSWYVRPEDIAAYEGAIDAFIVPTNLLRPYLEQSYNGSLSFLFAPVLDVENKALPQTFVQHRLDCNQRCQLPNASCHYCSRVTHILNQMKGLIDNERSRIEGSSV